MKLSELVAFRNRLNELPVGDAKQVAQDKLDIIMHTITYPSQSSMVQLTEPFMSTLEKELKEISSAFTNFSTSIDKLKQQVRDQITEQEKHCFQESYRLFEEAELCETTDQILHGRRVTGTKSTQTLEAEDTLRARLSIYADWRWPGMIIRPGLEDYIESMVGCDPLYIIDREHDLLRPCLDRFPLLYQNRLRPYTTNDWSDQPILDKIPNNQFGICLAYNVFDHRPLEIIRKYLTEIYQKLRPGGVLLMTYNDCDLASAVILVEQYCASYTPGYLIRDLVKDIGFEQLHSWSDGGPSVWLELRKPGQSLSIRGGQVTSTIKQIEECFQDVDFLRRRVYTEEEIAELQVEADNLNIEQSIIDKLCATYPYELDMLIADTKFKLHRQAQEKKLRKQLTKLAKQHNVKLDDTNWSDFVLVRSKIAAIENGVDFHLPNWEDTLNEILIKQEEEKRKIAEEIEKKRIEELHQRARSYNINPLLYDKEEEIHREIAEAIDRGKKEELKQLRQRAMELNAGDPNLIRYGYSAEKLKKLIKAKEEGQ